MTKKTEQYLKKSKKQRGERTWLINIIISSINYVEHYQTKIKMMMSKHLKKIYNIIKDDNDDIMFRH